MECCRIRKILAWQQGEKRRKQRASHGAANLFRGKLALSQAAGRVGIKGKSMSKNGYKVKIDYKKFFPESEREIELKIGDIIPVGGQFYTVINENDPGKDERKMFVILKGAYRQDKEYPNTWHKIIMCSRAAICRPSYLDRIDSLFDIGQRTMTEIRLRGRGTQIPFTWSYGTRADRIRLMSNKELALLFAATNGCLPDDDYRNAVLPRYEEEQWLEWLQEGVREESEDKNG